jgi:hypothetical protein
MSEPSAPPTPTPPAAGSPPPAAGGSAPPAATPPAGAPPPAPSRPEWLPEAHWDPQGNAIKLDDFGKHYTELSTSARQLTEQAAALAARKPEDIKFEVKLPETVKVPEGFQLKINEDDPRIPPLRAAAIKHGWSQDTIDALVAMDAELKIAEHTAEQARLAEEDRKLGGNATDRKTAIVNCEGERRRSGRRHHAATPSTRAEVSRRAHLA